MKRKIKITESQYNILKQSLVETPFDKLAVSNIKVGDTIVEIGNSGTKSSFKVLQSFAGQITMEGISPDVVKYIYTITSTSLHGNVLSGYYIDKQSYEQNPKNIKDWLKINKKIKDFQVFRGNNLIDAADFNGKSSIGANLPAQAGSKLPATINPEPNAPNNLPVPSDDAENGYHPYEELPNDGTSSSGKTQNADKEPYKKEYYPFEDLTDDELKDEGKKAYNMIDFGDDPLLRKAFHKQAGFWTQFKAELAGKEAPAGGITAALKILNKYVNSHITNKIGDKFNPNKQVKYKVLEDVIIPLGRGKTFTRLTNGTYYILVKPIDAYVDHEQVLRDGVQKYSIKVKNKTEIEDVYDCDFEKLVGDEPVVVSARVQFFPSEGYTDKTVRKPENKEKTSNTTNKK